MSPDTKILVSYFIVVVLLVPNVIAIINYARKYINQGTNQRDADIIRELNYIMDAIMAFSYRRNAKDMTGVKVNFDKRMRDLKRGLETVRKMGIGSDFFKREIIWKIIKDSEFDDKQRTDWAFSQLSPLNGMTDTDTIMKATDEFINLLPEITELMTTGTEEDIQKFCDKVSRERS